MLTKTVRSRFSHEIGGKVEGCTIIEKTEISPPIPAEKRLGIYDYVVEVAPTIVPTRAAKKAARTVSPRNTAPEKGSFTRATPDEIGGGVIRRLPSR